MSIKTDLRTLLKAQAAITTRLADNKSVYVGSNAGQKSQLPHIVISTNSTDPLGTLEETEGLKFEDIDIDCKATAQAKAGALADAVSGFLKDYTGTAGDSSIKAVIWNDQSDDYVPDGEGTDTGVYYETLDFSIQYV